MTQPSDDFKARYSAAKRFRATERPYIEEVLSFCCPGREFDFSRTVNSRAQDTERFIDLPEELASDLGGDLVNYFTPVEVQWFEYDVDVTEIPEQFHDTVEQIVSDREAKLRRLIMASNYNDVSPQWGFEAASHGTPALWVDVGHLSHPVYVEAVQPHELLITPGYLGILDRFREKTVSSNTLTNLFQGLTVDLTDEKLQAKMRKPSSTSKVCWGFWLDWGDPGNPIWRYEITVDDKLVTGQKQELGPMSGSCPLLVGRFNPQSGRPWGRGPGRRAAASMRVADQLAEDVLSAMDQTLRRSLIYPDDGFLDMSKGVEAGVSYPARSTFTKDNVFDLSRDVNVDQGYFSEERQEERLRRLFYQDGPRQRGDTPPTAAQWLDERQRLQQRLGKPSAPLWSELILPMIQRFEYLGVQLRHFEQSINVDGRIVNLTPISPLMKAQNMDKVNITRSNLDLGMQAFGPDAMAQLIDGAKTYENVIKASGDELLVVRKEDPNAAPAATG